MLCIGSFVVMFNCSCSSHDCFVVTLKITIIIILFINTDDIIFTQEPGVQTLSCSSAALDQTAVFYCHYEGSIVHPYWLINSTIYTSLNSQLPPDHSYESNQLIVENLPGQYTTKYQCFLLFSERGTICAYRSEVGKLIIPNCKGVL